MLPGSQPSKETNLSPHLTVLAPGGGTPVDEELAKLCESNGGFFGCSILSTITHNLLPPQKVRDLLEDVDPNNPNAQGYDFGKGTSYAAAHVSMLVSLMMSVNEKLRSDPAKIEEILCERALPIGVENRSGKRFWKWQRYFSSLPKKIYKFRKLL